MEHLRPEKIIAYIEGQFKGDEAMATEGHLAVCDECFKTFSGLKGLGRAMQIGFRSAEAGRDCPEDWILGAFVKSELESKELKAAEEHVKTCAFCLDRTVAYHRAAEAGDSSIKASEIWKERAVSTLQGTREKAAADAGEKISGFANVFDIFTKYSRLLPPLPGYALAAAMAVLLILAAMPEKARVITLHSTEKLAFKSDGALSSFGFMGTERVESFTGMMISESDGRFNLAWKEIPGASEYVVTITGRVPDDVLTAVKTNTPGISITAEKLKNNELYSWSIGGTTKSGEAFEYTGEFVIAQ